MYSAKSYAAEAVPTLFSQPTFGCIDQDKGYLLAKEYWQATRGLAGVRIHCLNSRAERG